ncbi:MAG TPA: hypothetical protein VFE16_12615 [Candidatus Cybelea sp.]|nr:hypothetical protein [Candidatus Cybelea sp.]
MTAFEHISVLISIVIGFAITTLLAGAVRLVHRRDSVIWYWPSALWMLTLLIIDIQVWWSRFAWRNLPTWTFATFIAMLLVPIGAYVLSALLVAEPAEFPIDLRKEYFTRRQVFFGVVIATLAASYLPDLMTTGTFGKPVDAWSKALMIALDVPALVTKNEGYHKFLAVAALLIFCGYVAVLFSRI